MLKKLNLTNFKCYRKQNFEFASLTIFCGNNSVGKSTAIQAFAVPFQSKFHEFVQLNGELVSLGTYKDICFRGEKLKEQDEHLEVVIDFLIGSEEISLSYGFGNFEEQQKLGNKITLKDESRNAAKIHNWYFSQFGFQFLEAERFGPRNSFDLNDDADIVDWVGAKGEYTLELIYKLMNLDRKHLNEHDPRMHPDSKNVSIQKNIELWMSEISPGFRVSPSLIEDARISHATFSTRNSSNSTKPINMGFGLSYALGIVTALLVTKPNGLVVIENPEAHLHPRGQSYLGRLIALAALASVQVIVETHSDHLINGIRVVARLNQNYSPDKFKVIYASAEDGESGITEISIGSKGELSTWPKGFFDQQAIDLGTIMRGEERFSE